jgi:sigma-B regulation protein RsbU (phosphoserine phosphatase)
MLRLRRHAQGWLVTSCSAGHPLPLLVTRDGSVQPVGSAGSLIGVLDEVELAETQTTLQPGQTLVVHTDGVPEGRHDDAFYGDDRLLHLLSQPHPGADELASAVLQDVLDFQQGVARDDVAIVTLRVPDPTVVPAVALPGAG